MNVLDAYQLLLVALNAVCSALFFYISFKFLTLYLRIKVGYVVLFSMTFAMLATGHVASSLSVLVPEPRLSLTLYTLSSSLASSGFFVLLCSILYASKERVFALVPPLILIVLPDMVAFMLSLLVTILARGRYLKGYLAVLSLAYLVRGLSSLLIPLGIGVYMLLASELSKMLVTLLFAVYHLGKVIKA